MILCSARVTSDFFQKVIKQACVGAVPALEHFLQGRQHRGGENTQGFLRFKGVGVRVRCDERSVKSGKEKPHFNHKWIHSIFPPLIPLISD